MAASIGKWFLFLWYNLSAVSQRGYWLLESIYTNTIGYNVIWSGFYVIGFCSL